MRFNPDTGDSAIAEFLYVCIADDEESARVRFVEHRWIDGKMRDIPIRIAHGVWAWPPDRVLADCVAKRERVKIIDGDLADDPADETADQLLRLEAAPYANRPGYDPEWKPRSDW